MSRVLVAISTLFLAGAADAGPTQNCTPVTPVACPNCFAVFVMPDTQLYTHVGTQPRGANHLDLVTRYICAHRTRWTEPTTGKQMPILMVIQLGDIVQNGDLAEPEAGPLAEWARADAAFDNLDACDPVVPYLVTLGNHDLAQPFYEADSLGYESYFGTDRWTRRGYGCDAPDACDWQAGQWFIGGGDPIAARSRNNAAGPGSPGPARAHAGRHRAGMIRAPDGRPFLFLGLELAFDYPPAPEGFEDVEGDDTAWPLRILSLHPDVPTVVFHHSMLWASGDPVPQLRWGPETWHSDSIPPPAHSATDDPTPGTVGGMQAVYERLVEPFPQARFLFTGHVLKPVRQADYTIERAGAPPVWGFLRNYQSVGLGANGYGVGWNVIAVFDPDAGQVRVRSYRIDDVAAYADPPANLDHVGQPAPTECLDTDEGGVPERIISWDFRTDTPATPPRPATASGE